MECENGTVIQKLYPNANCSDEPFRQNEDIGGYCGGEICEEYAMVLTSLNDSCSIKDGYWILPMLINDCYQYSFGQDKGGSYQFICDDSTEINLGIFQGTDCSDDTYQSYTTYKNEECDDTFDYAEIISCPNNHAMKLSVLFTILFVIVHTIMR